jgi:hypothetical protein
LTPAQAAVVAEEVQAAVTARTAELKRKALERLLKQASGLKQRRAIRQAGARLIEASNVGALSSAEYWDQVGPALGYPTLTAEERAAIKAKADALQLEQNPEKRAALAEMLHLDILAHGRRSLDERVAQLLKPRQLDARQWVDALTALKDEIRLNYFSPFSAVLDLYGNASEMTFQAAGNMGHDLVHLLRGNASLPAFQAYLGALRHRAVNATHPLDVRLELAFGRTASGENLLGDHVFSSWPHGERGTFNTRRTWVGKTTDIVRGAPLYTKGMVDLAAKRFTGVMVLLREARVAADQQGLRGADRAKFVEEFFDNPPQPALELAIEEANKAGYNRSLTKFEEWYGRQPLVHLVVDTFARWPLQALRATAESLGVNPTLWGRVMRGEATSEQVAQYLAKTAAGWGGLLLLASLIPPGEPPEEAELKALRQRVARGDLDAIQRLTEIDNASEQRKREGYLDYRTAQWVRTDGQRVNLAMYPLPEMTALLALFRGETRNAANILPKVSAPGLRLLTGQQGIIGPVVEAVKDGVKNDRFWTVNTQRQLMGLINRLVPGQAVLGVAKQITDPTQREGVGGNLPGISYLVPASISPTTGDVIQPEQDVFGARVPSVGGVVIPGAATVRDPLYATLSRYGLLTHKGLRQPVAGVEPSDLNWGQRRQWNRALGEERQRWFAEVQPQLPDWERQYTYDQIRKALRDRDAKAYRHARERLGMELSE